MSADLQAELGALVAYITVLEAERDALKASLEAAEGRAAFAEAEKFASEAKAAQSRPVARRNPNWTGPVGNMGQPILTGDAAYVAIWGLKHFRAVFGREPVIVSHWKKDGDPP